jgi:hypothetical protein
MRVLFSRETTTLLATTLFLVAASAATGTVTELAVVEPVRPSLTTPARSTTSDNRLSGAAANKAVVWYCLRHPMQRCAWNPFFGAVRPLYDFFDN